MSLSLGFLCFVCFILVKFNPPFKRLKLFPNKSVNYRVNQSIEQEPPILHPFLGWWQIDFPVQLCPLVSQRNCGHSVLGFCWSSELGSLYYSHVPWK